MDSYNSNHCDNNDDNNNNNNNKKNSSTNSNNNNDNNNNSNDNSINQQLLYVLFSLFLNLSKKVVFKQLVGCFKYLVLYMKVIFVRIFSRRLLWFENESSSVCIWKVSWFDNVVYIRRTTVTKTFKSCCALYIVWSGYWCEASWFFWFHLGQCSPSMKFQTELCTFVLECL